MEHKSINLNDFTARDSNSNRPQDIFLRLADNLCGNCTNFSTCERLQPSHCKTLKVLETLVIGF